MNAKKCDVEVVRLPNSFGTFDFRVKPMDDRKIEFYYSEDAAMAAAQTLADQSGGKVIEN